MLNSNIILLLVYSLTLLACSQEKNAKAEPKISPKGSPGVCEASAKISGNILGGTVVNVGDTDDKMVMILFNTADSSICTAAAISDNVLLTAAHCVSSDPKKIIASFYPSIKCSSGYDVTKYSIRATKIVTHASYDTSLPIEQRTGDIALVFLQLKIPQGYPVYHLADPSELSNANSMYLYGYGVTGSENKDAGVLRKAILEPGRYIVHQDLKKVEVSQDDGSGFCMGDSGGPSLVKMGDQFQILGLNSYVKKDPELSGDICTAKGFQTLAHSYKNWIQTQLDKSMDATTDKPAVSATKK